VKQWLEYGSGDVWLEIRKELGLYLESMYREELQKERMSVSFSRSKNIGDLVTCAKLYKAPDKSASTVLGEFSQ